MIRLFKSSLLALISLSTIRASAATVARVDAKKTLNLSEGDYLVVSADSAFQKENFCVKGLIHTIRWVGSPNVPTLSVGAAFSYTDINEGLKTDSQPYYQHHCVYRTSTQAQAGKLISDVFTNCDDSNATTHSELLVNDQTIEFSSEMKVSRAGKVLSIPSKCSLRKIVKKAAVPAALLDTPGL